MLRVAGLSRPGVHPVDFEIADGDCALVLGKSGSGKSLLLRAIADLDPNDGDVILDGRSRNRMPAAEWRSLVTYVAADGGWWRDRVGDHFAVPDAALGFLVRLGLPADALDWQVARLSTGERQRLALLRALTQTPRVLLLDEPTSALDGEAVARVESLLHEKLADGTAILMVTHDKAQAKRMNGALYRMTAGTLSREAVP